MSAMDIDAAAAAGLKRSAQTIGSVAAKVAKTDQADAKDKDKKGGKKGAHKKGEGKGSENKEFTGDQMQTITVILGKLALTDSREIATLRSVVIKTMLIKKDKVEHICNALKQVNKDYTATVKGLTPSQRSEWSSPHVFIWLELVSLIIKETKEHKEEPKQKSVHTQLLDHLDKLRKQVTDMKSHDIDKDDSGLMRTVVAQHIKMAKLSTCWDPSRMKLEVAADVGTEHAMQAAQSVLMFFEGTADGVLKSGAAPKGDLERRLATLLDN
eukprot:TRINITY_DN37042_c0_g1_i1.p2 TRINITY_DN37042_c0_g1~~TRINITY_DN37042_c0_g1_i1.p2  ORF type:complete len:269 (+),score=109.39 TRINITY_DN37042_c0_g1_i1:107-913(+)